APHLEHGARTRAPQRSPEWSPAVLAAISDLEGRVGAELRGPDGELHPWAVPSVETVAIARVAVARAERFTADAEARGRLKMADLDTLSKVNERLHRALEREGLTLRSRLEAQGQAFDLARAMSELEDADG
ncbi:MAG: hypothetical protein M3P48_03015, partial [Actinomycetota bacterium]|nr:hypothetical protein [Actinomycetota bacterium]